MSGSVDSRKDKSWIPQTPTMGGLIKVGKDDYMAWTGGQPDTEWLHLEDENPQPKTVLQYRPSGGNSIKGYISRTRGLKTKFDKNSELEEFVINIFDHLKQSGLDTISYLPDPAQTKTDTSDNEMISVVEHHGKFTLSYTKEEIKKYRERWDTYDKQNDTEATLFLINSLQTNFKKNIQQIVSDKDTFCEVWITIMRKCNQNSLEYFKKMEVAIKNTSPLTFDGQNMDLWAQAVRTNVNLLVNSGQYDHKLSEHILNQALTAGGDGNEDWRSVLRIIKRDLKVKLSVIGLFSDKKDADRVMAEADLSPEDILSKIESEYVSLMNTDEWPPAQNKIDPSAPPAHKFAAATALTTTTDHNLRPNAVPSGLKHQPYYNNRYPRGNRNNNKKPFTPRRNKGQQQAWKSQAPKQGEPQQKTVNAKKWFWCQKCNNGKGRWTLSHGTAQHRSDLTQKKQNNQPPTSRGKVQTTTANNVNETTMGVWCTALEVSQDTTPPAYQLVMYLMMGFLIGVFVTYKSMGVMSTLSSHHHSSTFAVLPRLWTFTHLIPQLSYDTLSILQLMIITWCGFFVWSGAVPIDDLLEYYLAGGKKLYLTTVSSSSIILDAILRIIKVLFAVSINYQESLFGFCNCTSGKMIMVY